MDFCVFVTLSFENQDGIIKIIVGEEWEEVAIIKLSAIFLMRQRSVPMISDRTERLLDMQRDLMHGNAMNKHRCAVQFGVSEKTIQRDF